MCISDQKVDRLIIIARGACTGSLSSCAVFGFALETVCHTGKVILYDTVGELGWSVDIRTHSIAQVIERILLPGSSSCFSC